MPTYKTIKIRRDSTLNWYASNPRLGLGELGVDMDLQRLKVGNGIDRWNQLPYLNDDAYKLLNKLKEVQTDTEQEIRHEIESNKLESDQKIANLIRDYCSTDRDLTARMNGVESRQADYETEVSGLVSGMKKELDAGLEDFSGTKDKLTVRLDEIAGSATEDTEILDARVDAEDETHPNLGDNIRSLHSKVLQQRKELSEKLTGLMSDIEELEKELRKYAEDERVRQAIRDADLKTYSEEAAEREARQRENSDGEIQREVSKSGEGILQTNLTLKREIETRKNEYTRLLSKIKENEEKDAELSEGLLREQANRESADVGLSDRIRSTDKRQKEQEAAILREAEERREQDDFLQIQEDELSEASLRAIINLAHEAEQRRKDIQQTQKLISTESAERIHEDKEIRTQTEQEISRLEEAISKETVSREKADGELHADIEILQGQDNALYQGQKKQSERTDELGAEITRVKALTENVSEELSEEERIRELSDKKHDDQRAKIQTQLEDLSGASIEGILKSYKNAHEIRACAEKISILYGHIDSELLKARGYIEGLSEKESRQRESSDVEIQREVLELREEISEDKELFELKSREQDSRDISLQRQLDDVSCAGMEGLLRSYGKMKELSSLCAGLKAGLEKQHQNLEREERITMSAREREAVVNASIEDVTAANLITTLGLSMRDKAARQHRHEALRLIEGYSGIETQQRRASDGGLQAQLNTLGELSIHHELEMRTMRAALKEWVKAAGVIYQTAADTGNLTYMGAKVASGNEVDDMLKDILSGKDSDWIRESEIPEGLRDQISNPEEVSEMLSEIFSR